jgi:hypothetical protein
MSADDSSSSDPSRDELEGLPLGLSATEVGIMEALAAGLSQRQTAEVNKVHPKTVQRKMADPAFAVLVAQRRAARVREITGQLTEVAATAVDVIREAQAPDNPMPVRLAAARLALHSLTTYHASTEVDAQIAELQQVVAQLQAMRAEGGE